MAKQEAMGIGNAIQRLMELNEISAEQLIEHLGQSRYTAIMENNYDFITIADMREIADLFGLIFVMNFQSMDMLYKKPGAGDNYNGH